MITAPIKSESIDRPFDIGQPAEIFKFLRRYRTALEYTKTPRRALVIGKNDFPFVEFFDYGNYKAFGIVHHLFTKRSGRYALGEYDEMPFRDKAFALVVATQLHMWHVDQGDIVVINDAEMAHEVYRILQDGGFFLANMEHLQGFALHLVHAGFVKMENMFGNIDLWQKDAPTKPSNKTSVRQYLRNRLNPIVLPRVPKKPKELDMATPQPASGGLDRIRDFVRSIVPGADMLITSIEENRPGWERLPFLWNNLAIWIRRPVVYDRQIKSGA